MPIANRVTYLDEVLEELHKKWPENRNINIACHGHSVPAGYFSTPYVDTFHSYPHLLHKELKERFPFATLNVIVTSIGGENSWAGSERFERDVLNHKPDVITIDYGLNDRWIGLEASRDYISDMIKKSTERNIKVILLTPSWDNFYFSKHENWFSLIAQAEQIRSIASEFGVGLSDSFSRFQQHIDLGGDLSDLLSHANHPNRTGHELIANEIARWFLAR